MYFLYRFLNKNNNIIYVGKTTNPMKKRMNRHRHCPKQCYQERTKVLYAELETKADLFIYEVYYINKYMPKYNKATKYKKQPQSKIIGLVWKDYETGKIVQDDSKNLQNIYPIISNLYKKIQFEEKTIKDLKEIIESYQKTLEWQEKRQEEDSSFYRKTSEELRLLCEDWTEIAFKALNEKNETIKKYNILYRKHKKTKLISNIIYIIIFLCFCKNIMF